jgi:hypothetical protein
MEADGTVVVFEAGELGAGRELTDFSVIAKKVDFRNRDLCTKSSHVSVSVGTEGGIRLGLSRKQVKAMLGTPTEEDDRRLFYVFRIRRRMSEEEIEAITRVEKSPPQDPYVDISSYVEAIFWKSRIISITITKIETA